MTMNEQDAIQRDGRRFLPHQEKAIEAARRHYLSSDRGQMILPCGAGKTATACGIRECLGARSTLVLVPSLWLVSQVRDEWARWRTSPYESLCVCSDTDEGDDGDAVDMGGAGVRGEETTDPSAIAAFLGRPGHKVLFSTYQSLEAVSLGARKAGAIFDLAVCDEAHRTAGHGMRLFGDVHHEARVRASRRLYMTATPRVAPSTGTGTPGLALYDMDDPSVFGRPFFTMTFRQAIDLGLLADYSVVAIGVADGQVREWMRESALCGDCGPIEDVARNFALDLAMTRYGARRAISYHSLVDDALDFTRRHERLFPRVVSTHVSGRQSPSERKACLKRFASAPIATVSNARCLVEGFNMRAVDMVYFCDPKTSTIDIVQAAGRALRLDPSRPDKRGLIVLPVFHSSAEDLDVRLADGDFSRVADVLRALSAVDEALKGEIAWRSSKGDEDRTRSASEDVDDATDDGDKAGQESGRVETPAVVVSGFDGALERSLFEQVVGGREAARDAWREAHAAMLRFRESNPGRWPSPGETSPEGIDLWGWRRAMRRADRRGTLPESRRRLLEECGLLAEARPSWVIQYQRLRSFRSARPGTWPSGADEHPAGNRLGAWCAAQRRARRQGRLSEERVRLLDELGFPWETASHAEVRSNALA